MSKQKATHKEEAGSGLLHLHSLMVQWLSGVISHDDFLDHMFTWAQDYEEQKKARTHQVKTGSRSSQKKSA